MAEGQARFTPKQWQQLRAWQLVLEQAEGWNGELPVVVHERCWLRLRAVPVAELCRQVPPDTSTEAPELVRYRERLRRGEDPWQAQLLCWEEFGQQACQTAQLTFWQRQDGGGWTLAQYLDLISRYRRQLEQPGPRSLPILLTARGASREPHRLLWLGPSCQPMRHTCA
ncbi:hypothetical protein [Cyanobium sp. NIES-981]|uniref:hypothetical protein n=1 Tax=Cyanobium sp. NIES-981 TaxID=1851505 RepID=UPI0012FC8B98|nr:hypothetical protein [Cyanobium sp. NIES-981]